MVQPKRAGGEFDLRALAAAWIQAVGLVAFIAAEFAAAHTRVRPARHEDPRLLTLPQLPSCNASLFSPGSELVAARVGKMKAAAAGEGVGLFHDAAAGAANGVDGRVEVAAEQ